LAVELFFIINDVMINFMHQLSYNNEVVFLALLDLDIEKSKIISNFSIKLSVNRMFIYTSNQFEIT